MSFFPLDRDILTSSVWAQGSPEANKLWIYLLLEADPRSGIVSDAAPAIAMRCGLPLDVTLRELEWLAAPDKHSRTSLRDGRRIEPLMSGGYRLLNYLSRQNKDYSTGRVRSWRDRQLQAKRSETPSNGGKRRKRSGTTDKDKDTLNDGGSSTTPAPSTTPEKEPISGATAPATIKDAQKQVWTREACDDWIARFGGTAPGGQITGHLNPLVKKHRWEGVRPAWQNYLAQSDAQYASPARFAATFNGWHDTIPPAPVPQEPLPPQDQEATAFFDAMRVRLSGVIPPHEFVTWFRPVQGWCWEQSRDLLVLRVPSPQFARQMRYFKDRLRAAASELGRPELGFRTIVAPLEDDE